MTDKQIEEMIYSLLLHVDYDTAKNLYAETAEEPEFADEFRETLIDIVKGHLNEQKLGK